MAAVKTLPPVELSAFCAQLSMILKSGMTLSEGLSVMEEDSGSSQGREILQILSHTIEEGESLSAALEKAKVFPKYMVDMVRIGGESGQLDQVLDSLYDYYEREEFIAKSIKSAVTYPLVMIGMMLVIIAVLVIKVLPIFRQVFLQLGGEASPVSSGAMEFGSALGGIALALAALVALIVVALLVMGLTPGGKAALTQFQASFFATKRLAAKIASGRVASALSLTLSSGLDTDESLEMAMRLVDNSVMKNKLERCRTHIAQGESFADALVKEEIFTGLYGRMVAVGFKTGSADSVMKKLADRYEEEIDTQIGSVISILEPTLVAVLSIIVGMILLSVMLPLMGVMTSIG